jgi:anti-anti-sigma regulatory factor
MKQMQRKRSGVAAPRANRAVKKPALPIMSASASASVSASASASTSASASAAEIAGTDELSDRELLVSNAGTESSPGNAPIVVTESPREAHSYVLSASCTVRDCIALRSALLDLLMDPMPVTIDVHAVERIDTAALQLLCAFVRDRQAAGGQILWTGRTESFSEAIRLLGLQKALAVPDALLIGAAA